MAKGNGTTRSVGSGVASAPRTSGGVSSTPTAKLAIDNSKVKIPSMPGRYKSVTFETSEGTYSISHVPTGYGALQQKRNGRFTLTKPDGDYHDFRYGDSYSGYTSAKEAYSEVKAWIKKFYLK